MSKYLLLFMSLSLSGCFDIKGDKAAFIYPDEGIANVYTITESCPVKVSTPVQVPISQLAGYICLSPEQAAKYRREYEKSCD